MNPFGILAGEHEVVLETKEGARGAGAAWHLVTGRRKKVVRASVPVPVVAPVPAPAPAPVVVVAPPPRPPRPLGVPSRRGGRGGGAPKRAPFVRRPKPSPEAGGGGGGGGGDGAGAEGVVREKKVREKKPHAPTPPPPPPAREPEGDWAGLVELREQEKRDARAAAKTAPAKLSPLGKKFKDVPPFATQLRALALLEDRIKRGEVKLSGRGDSKSADSARRLAAEAKARESAEARRLSGEDGDDDDYALGLTDNGAAAHSSSGSGRLDLFFGGLVRGSSEAMLIPMLEASWAESPENTLQLLLHGRDCRGGKGERECVLHCLMWLRTRKPATYLLNLSRVLNVGYFKDFLKIATRVTKGALPQLGVDDCIELEIFAEQLKKDLGLLTKWNIAKEEEKKEKEKAGAPGAGEKKAEAAEGEGATTGDRKEGEPPAAAAATATATATTTKAKVEEAKKPESETSGKDEKKDEKKAEKKDDEKKEEGKEEKKEEEEGEDSDGEPGESKSEEKKKKKRLRTSGVSLAAKWAPTEHTSFDKQARLAKRLAYLLFPGQKTAFRLYRQLIAPLREHTTVLERFMCLGQWDKIDFSHVPSMAHHRSKEAFAKHQPERYLQYQQDLNDGKAKVNTTGLQPHLLVEKYMQGGELDATVEAQWRTIAAGLRESGRFGSALSIVDVSGSMSGVPMLVAITLGLLVAELAAAPYHNRVLTFHSNPTWHKIEGRSLCERVANLRRAAWGMTTDLMKCFCLILDTAKANKIAPRDMPKTLFIFSDMQFDQAARGQSYLSIHGQAKKLYAANGYKLPGIVYWNLRPNKTSFPTSMDTPDVAMISGFSSDLLKLFLENSELTPIKLMEFALVPYVVEIDARER